MPRFFTSAVQFDEAASVGSAVIDGEDGRHIARSLRMHTATPSRFRTVPAPTTQAKLKASRRYRHGAPYR